MQRKVFADFKFVLVMAAVLGLFGSLPARASLIVSVQSVAASSGAFDVTLTNSGPGAVAIAGFTFNLSTTDTDISFSDATTATALAPYIFPAASSQDTLLFGGDLLVTTPNSGQNFNGNLPSDLNVDPITFNSANITIGAGVTVGLGHVLFTVAAGAAPGIFAIQLGPTTAETNLVDANGDNIAIDTLTAGQITIASAAVPEPGLLLPLALAFLLGGAVRRRVSN